MNAVEQAENMETKELERTLRAEIDMHVRNREAGFAVKGGFARLLALSDAYLCRMEGGS